MEKILLVDLDEVFADFTSGALSAHGVSREEFERKRIPGTWDMTIPLDMTHDEFWKPIVGQGPEFWLRLKPLPWAPEFKRYLNSLNVQWFIVTSPNHDPDCVSAKIRWCRRFFGRSRPDPIPLSEKWLLSSPNKVLIDDKWESIAKFVKIGGQGILFPSKGNILHLESENPLFYVKEQIECHLASPSVTSTRLSPSW